jgi:hypothetical protein
LQSFENEGAGMGGWGQEYQFEIICRNLNSGGFSASTLNFAIASSSCVRIFGYGTMGMAVCEANDLAPQLIFVD